MRVNKGENGVTSGLHKDPSGKYKFTFPLASRFSLRCIRRPGSSSQVPHNLLRNAHPRAGSLDTHLAFEVLTDFSVH